MATTKNTAVAHKGDPVELVRTGQTAADKREEHWRRIHDAMFEAIKNPQNQRVLAELAKR